MSSSLQSGSATALAEPAGFSELVPVRVDELIVGRPLQSAMFDEHGILLLAAGNLITSDFKRLLKQRGDGSVRATIQDASRIRLTVSAPEPVHHLKLDEETTNRLDRLVDNGLLQVENTGPAVRDRFVCHGRKAYSSDRQTSLQEQRKAASESMGGMLKEALRGNSVSSTDVTRMAAECLTDLADDADCKLNVALQISQEPSIADHCLKMSTLGMALGVELGLDEDNCKRIGIAGLVHDWGMGAVPPELRNADRILTEHEMFQIRKHPSYTVDMLERMPGIPSVVPVVVYQVHEQPCGRGYPRGRCGDRIHLFSRILAVADTYAALTSARPFRNALTPYAAMECVVKLARNKTLDPDVVRALLKVLTLFPIGSFVALSDGQIARVIRRNGDRYTTPVIQLIQDVRGQPVDPARDDATIDLADSALKIVQALPTPGTSEQVLSDNILTVPRPYV